MNKKLDIQNYVNVNENYNGKYYLEIFYVNRLT